MQTSQREFALALALTLALTSTCTVHTFTPAARPLQATDPNRPHIGRDHLEDYISLGLAWLRPVSSLHMDCNAFWGFLALCLPRTATHLHR
jgi:hypothetical protein